MLSREMQEDRL